MQPSDQPLAADGAASTDDGLAEAVVAAMLARLRSIRVLMETQPGGVDPFSTQAATHARLLAMEARLEARRAPGPVDDEVFYLD